MGGWVSPRDGMNVVEKRKISCRESKPGRPDLNPFLYRMSYPDSPITYVVILKSDYFIP
jgi:hypothetical protein